MSSAQWRKTACNLCYINCGLEVLVDEDRITKVRGDRDNPKSEGYLCNKAARIPYYAHHKDRLTSPLRRRDDGSFEAIDWNTAIAEIASRLRGIVQRYGGKSVAFGRFFGPVRAVIPLVAGMMNMPPWRFVVANVVSALAWAPAYLLPE